MRSRRFAGSLAIIVVVTLTTNLAPLHASLARAVGSGAAGQWPYANANLANTRDAVGSTIDLNNVSTLAKAWDFTLSGRAKQSVGGYGTLSSAPVVVDGVVYVQDLHSNVYALSLATGRLQWAYVVNKKEKSGPGPNGVAVVNGVVYGATPTSVFALDASNGHRLWTNARLLTKGEGTFGIQPQVANGRVYLASQYGRLPGGGVLLALRVSNGDLLWRFKTVPNNDEGVSSLGVGAGGAWETPLVSADGSVTFGIGNPYQTLSSALAIPHRILYTDSDVNLDAATGALRWYFQAIPDDFKDYDLQTSPISTEVRGASVVLGAGKMGIVYEMNASSGELLWKTPVGIHDGHDDDSLKALDGKRTPQVPFTYSPGALGGILTNMAVASGSVYVVTGNLPFEFTSTAQVNGTPVTKNLSGNVVALNLATGKVEWNTKVKGLPLGAATVSNDLVFTTLLQGELVAFNRATGAIVFRQQLPRSTNAPIAIAGNTVIVLAGGPKYGKRIGASQVVAYRLSTSK